MSQEKQQQGALPLTETKAAEAPKETATQVAAAPPASKAVKAATPPPQAPAIVNDVLNRVMQYQAQKQLTLPPDYAPENALRSAALILSEMTTRTGQSVLQGCTQQSVAQSLMDMVIQGLNPVKKQCAFIVYGDKLTMQRQYQGNMAIAKRLGVKDIQAHVVYKGDEFEYGPDNNGRTQIITHKQKLSNIDNNIIIGAYAVITDSNGTYAEIMTAQQIRQAWMKGAAKGESDAHKQFPDQMMKKTVISRAVKLIIQSSDDAGLYSDDEPEAEPIRPVIAPRTVDAAPVAIDIPHTEEKPAEAAKPDF